jgi:hypothetical protein
MKVSCKRTIDSALSASFSLLVSSSLVSPRRTAKTTTVTRQSTLFIQALLFDFLSKPFPMEASRATRTTILWVYSCWLSQSFCFLPLKETRMALDWVCRVVIQAVVVLLLRSMLPQSN